MDLNDKIQRLAASKAYIATLEAQINDLKQSNHIMKIKLSASENAANETRSTPIYPPSSYTSVNNSPCPMCSVTARKNESDQTQILFKLSSLENKLEIIERTNNMEITYLRDRINTLEIDKRTQYSDQNSNGMSRNQKRNEHFSVKNQKSKYNRNFTRSAHTNQQLNCIETQTSELNAQNYATNYQLPKAPLYLHEEVH